MRLEYWRYRMWSDIMNIYDPIGYLASLLVLATFSVRSMVPLRLLAIASNLAFMSYAALAGIDPVLMLHALLLPVNVHRLLQIVREQPCNRVDAAP
jgi:CRP/FNR family transcriptional regulator, cyclic AMP receptor protein